ncbi:hypothetical protein DRQ53_04545 [bacterium]|nr:MAG: hypothetical protein DRQ53_04545 [bacterium]
MRSPSLPFAIASAICAGLLIAFVAPLMAPVTADPPERVDTVVPSHVRLATYESMLHVTPDNAPGMGEVDSRKAWDVESYRLAFMPDFDNFSLRGFVEIRITMLERGVDRIDLDLYDDFVIDNIFTGSTSLPHTHSDDILGILLPSALPKGDTLTLTISYHGTPQPAGMLGLAFETTPGGRPILETLSEPTFARSWWPCKDTVLDKATVEVQIVVPDHMFAASSGRLESVTYRDGTASYTWVTDYPMTTYNVSLAATEYVSWTEDYVSPEGNEFPLEFHVFPEHEQIARYEFARMGEMLDYFSELFGPYPFPDDKYGMAEVVLAGAMEHQTMTSYGDFFMTGDRYYEGIIAHELAHHWWGNLITLGDWNETWLHEGLATFSDALWHEYIGGRAGYLKFLRQRAANCCGFWGAISPPLKPFNETVYQKGAWLMHMLRELVGDDDFFEALRSITQNPDLRFGNFYKADFVEAFETQTGLQLDWFFDQWLHRTGRPDIAVQWVPEPGSSLDPAIRITVNQVQEDDVWTFPLRLRLDLPSGPVDHDLFITDRTSEFTISVSEWPLSIDIDPDEQLLHFDSGSIRVTDTPAARSGGTRLLPNSPNPFNPRTTLRFNLAETASVHLKIYDLRGRVTRTLDCGQLGPGEHEKIWDGTDDDGRSVASGNYLVRLEGVRTVTQARSVTLVR